MFDFFQLDSLVRLLTVIGVLYAEVAPGVNVELDKFGKVIGVEVLNASQVLKPIAKSLRA